MSRSPAARATVAALVLAGALSALPLAAQMPDIPPGKWWKRPRIVELLHISPDQQERLEEIFSKNRRGFIDLKADVERRQIDVEELMTRKDSDPKKVSASIDALDQARLRLGKARTMMVVEMKGILTAAQWQSILEKTEDWRRERVEGNRGGRRRMDGPLRDGPRDGPRSTDGGGRDQ